MMALDLSSKKKKNRNTLRKIPEVATRSGSENLNAYKTLNNMHILISDSIRGKFYYM